MLIQEFVHPFSKEKNIESLRSRILSPLEEWGEVVVY